jgi:hypothetical protein
MFTDISAPSIRANMERSWFGTVGSGAIHSECRNTAKASMLRREARAGVFAVNAVDHLILHKKEFDRKLIR